MTRTLDLLLRGQTLYPTELKAHRKFILPQKIWRLTGSFFDDLVRRGKMRYTPTHAVQQEPMKSAENGNSSRTVWAALVQGSRTITRTISLFLQSKLASPPQNTLHAFRHSPLRKHTIIADNHGKTTESSTKSTKPANTIPATISMMRPTSHSVRPPHAASLSLWARGRPARAGDGPSWRWSNGGETPATNCPFDGIARRSSTAPMWLVCMARVKAQADHKHN